MQVFPPQLTCQVAKQRVLSFIIAVLLQRNFPAALLNTFNSNELLDDTEFC